MAMDDDTESCGSRPVDSNPQHKPLDQQKLEVYNEVLRRLRDSGCEEALLPDFHDQLWIHFNRLPARYALDVNAERAEDVLMHKRLLKLAEIPANRPVFDVRLVQVSSNSSGKSADAGDSDTAMSEGSQSLLISSSRQGVHLPPTFGSVASLEALDAHAVEDGDSGVHSMLHFSRPMHEITFSTLDKPKLLSQLTSILAEIDLNIQEAHAFSTVDGFSLDVFVVDGWKSEETTELRSAVEKGIAKLQDHCQTKQLPLASEGEEDHTAIEFFLLKFRKMDLMSGRSIPSS